MKKTSKFLLVFAAMATVFLVPTLAHGQDSTAVSGSATGSVIETIIGALELKWPVIATVGTILFFISEALSGIKGVAANSVFKLVANVLSNLFGKKS